MPDEDEESEISDSICRLGSGLGTLGPGLGAGLMSSPRRSPIAASPGIGGIVGKSNPPPGLAEGPGVELGPGVKLGPGPALELRFLADDMFVFVMVYTS